MAALSARWRSVRWRACAVTTLFSETDVTLGMVEPTRSMMPKFPRFQIRLRYSSRAGHALRALIVLACTAMPAAALPTTRAAVLPPTPSNSESTVSFGVWLGALTELHDSTPAPAIEQEYERFVSSYALPADDPKLQRYPNWDVHADTRIPSACAEWLLHQVQVYAAATPALWSLVRAKRAFAMGSSMGACVEARAAWHAQLTSRLTDGDVSALKTLGTEELGLREPSTMQVLDWLKE